MYKSHIKKRIRSFLLVSLRDLKLLKPADAIDVLIEFLSRVDHGLGHEVLMALSDRIRDRTMYGDWEDKGLAYKCTSVFNAEGFRYAIIPDVRANDRTYYYLQTPRGKGFLSKKYYIGTTVSKERLNELHQKYIRDMAKASNLLSDGGSDDH